MKSGFRGWLYRWISAGFGLLGILVFLSMAELSRFYAFPALQATAFTGLGLSFLVFMTALLGEWSWKRYAILCGVFAAIFGLPYLALRPEMVRDEVLKQLKTPSLSVDLALYRGWMLRNDPERDIKIERLQFLYGLVNTYGENRHAPVPEAK